MLLLMMQLLSRWRWSGYQHDVGWHMIIVVIVVVSCSRIGRRCHSRSQ